MSSYSHLRTGIRHAHAGANLHWDSDWYYGCKECFFHDECGGWVAPDSSLLVCRPCWGEGRKPTPQVAESAGDGVLITMTPMGTNSGKSRGRLARKGARDKTVAFLKGIGVDTVDGDKILHYFKYPKLWELWYIPYNG